MDDPAGHGRKQERNFGGTALGRLQAVHGSEERPENKAHGVEQKQPLWSKGSHLGIHSCKRLADRPPPRTANYSSKVNAGWSAGRGRWDRRLLITNVGAPPRGCIDRKYSARRPSQFAIEEANPRRGSCPQPGRDVCRP